MLFEITVINDYDVEEADANRMMIGRLQYGVQGASRMYIEGVMNAAGVLLLVDSGSTHNVIDINVACAIGVQEQRINTTILVGSENKVPCRLLQRTTMHWQ
jgi:hypothetical protein